MVCYICKTNNAKSRNFHFTEIDHVYLCERCYRPASRRFNAQGGRLIPNRETWINLLERAYDKKSDAFRCEISKMKLNIYDSGDPLFLTLDHTVPGKNDFAVVAHVINDMKNDHSLKEFKRNIKVLATMIKQNNTMYSDKKARLFKKGAGGILMWRRWCTQHNG